MFDFRQPVTSLRWFDNPGIHQADWPKLIRDSVEGSGDPTAWGTVECETCGKVYVVEDFGGGEECRLMPQEEAEDDDGNPITNTCEGYVPTFEGPMMNAWHACGDIRDPRAAAKALDGLPLCLVYVDGGYGIAMTGGGMDMSWYLVEGFCRLGFVPPAYFRLPIMGERYGVRERFLTAALKRSILGEMNTLRNAMRDLKRTVADCKQNEDKRLAEEAKALKKKPSR